MEPEPATPNPEYNSKLREAMGRFVQHVDEAARNALSMMLDDECTLLLVPVCDVDEEQGDFRFTTTQQASDGLVLYVFTHNPARPKNDGAEQVLAMTLSMLVIDLGDLPIVRIIIDYRGEHSVTVHVKDGRYTLSSTQQLEGTDFFLN